jgi:putative iron-regulated protein
VLATYADIAEAGYEDAWLTAQQLQTAIDAFLAAPGPATHQAAKDAWRAARVPYQQTGAYRFGNAIVDDWEGRVNAWPLDEGLIDYVAAAYGTESDENLYYVANVVAHPKLASGGEEIEASTIDADPLRALHEIDAVEANVSTGYHAIEFLLWGQDLNGTGPGAGVRPCTDFAADACTGGNCERRLGLRLHDRGERPWGRAPAMLH